MNRILTLAVVIGVGVIVAGLGVSVARDGGGRATRSDGPEGVPLVGGSPLGPAGSPVPGHSVDGLFCGSGEQLAYHVHSHLSIFVKGKARAVPAGVGIGAPRRLSQTEHGAFVTGGQCFSFLHTHAADGVIHVEAPAGETYTLGQFFDLWGQRLDADHLGPFTGAVSSYVDGRAFPGDPRAILLHPHAQIQLDLGRPLVPPRGVAFRAGL